MKFEHLQETSYIKQLDPFVCYILLTQAPIDFRVIAIQTHKVCFLGLSKIKISQYLTPIAELKE